MPAEYDIIIKNANIVDGTGSPAFKGDIGIRRDKIVSIGDVNGGAVEQIDGTGLTLCPGFIDLHSHADLNILQYPLAENLVMQGVTTFAGGNCGLSLAPANEFMPFGIFTPSIVGGWWHEIEPYSYNPPKLLPLKKYRGILEEKLGYEIDWRTFGEFLDQVDEVGVSINYAPLVGHNTVRLAVMGEDFKRKARPEEIEAMKALINEAMKSGAFGMASGFDGGPGDFAPTDEVIELARVVQEHGGFYATHTRNSDNNYPSKTPEEWGYGICHSLEPDEMPADKYLGIMEAIEIATEAKIPGHISHVIPAYNIYQHYPEILQEAAAKATLDIFQKAVDGGLDLTFDVLPEEDLHGVFISGPRLIDLFSAWLKKLGSEEKFVENLKIRDFRQELKKEFCGGKFKILMINPKTDFGWMERPYIIQCSNQSIEGQTIGDISRLRNTDPFETMLDILIEDPNTKYNCKDPRWTETTVSVFLKHPSAIVATDLTIVPFGESELHGGGGIAAGEPGLATYAFYPRYIRRFVREKGVLDLEEAVKKATYLPARRLKLEKRGIIAAGAYADILLFDYEKISDKGTWKNPKVRPEGIVNVIVNGKIVYDNMHHTGLKPGKVIRRNN